ncbi:hypothetical protein PRIPAC_84126, partial [Pristionchus pacificus]|uniref:SH3 domain-containing protein n=1 Tax=Pristionchus pacificus TaxID=54126 RepID=A0A2A6BDE2_PRIPA
RRLSTREGDAVMGSCFSKQDGGGSTRNDALQIAESGGQKQSMMYVVNGGEIHNEHSTPHRNEKGHGDKEVLVALYSYESRADEDLGFKKGDVMYLLDSSNPDWWYVL